MHISNLILNVFVCPLQETTQYIDVFIRAISGFHLSASVNVQMLSTASGAKAQYNVAVTFDRRRITSCNCTCTSTAYWCSHVVAVCLHRIHMVSFCIRRVHFVLQKSLRQFIQMLLVPSQ